MDKYELKITLREIDRAISEGRLGDAADLADQIDWRRMKSIRELCKASDIYKANRRYEDSKRVLEMAYAKYPRGRRILFSLCELELKLGDFVRALQLYNEYRNGAPDDPDGFILQYKIYKAQNVSIQERIAVLEEFQKYDYREKWAYELAYLYYQAGERNLCIAACDELITFFGTGKYVLKALELKGSLTDLNTSQKKRYAALMRRVQDAAAPREKVRREAEVQGTAGAAEEPVGFDGEPAGPVAGPAEEKPETTQAAEEETVTETAPETDPKPAVSGDTVVYQKPEQVAPPVQEILPTEEELLPQLDPDAVPQEIPWDYSGDSDEVPVLPAERRESVTPAASAAPDRPEQEEAHTEADLWESPEDGEITQEAMQRMIAKGLQELHNYDTYLKQETDGQYSLVMQEEPVPEQQVPGQLSLEEIMTEWEKVRRSLYDPSEGSPEAAASGEDKADDGSKTGLRRRNTKSWDPEAVHDALRIKDDIGVNFDTSLFVTEDGGDFPGEYIPEMPPVRQGEGETLSRRNSVSIPYIHSEDSMRKMMAALEDVRLEGTTGNVVITGDEGSGTMSLARDLLARYRLRNAAFVGQTVKTKGYLIDRDNLSRAIVRIPFGALVIERASSISEEAAIAMTEFLSVPERNVIVILIDRKGNLDAFLRDHPALAGMFSARVDIAALGVDTLLGYAREYAARQNCEIDEYGINALRSRILSMQTVEYSVTLEDVRDLVDEAVYYAGRGILPGLRETLSGRRGAGPLRLRERDFLHYM